MYHCILRISLCGSDSLLEEAVRAACPRQRFSHAVSVVSAPDCGALAHLAQEDVILLGLEQLALLPDLRRVAKDGALIILAADAACADQLPESALVLLDDVWIGSRSLRFFSFCINKLLDAIQLRKDYRLVQQYLDTTINTTSDLVWFKDVRGAHIKVNDAFCRAVGKAREDVEGRGHYYIWDLKPEEYAQGEYVCLETEIEVLEKGQTCIFDEIVKSKQGMRQFKTWKSPIFDEDGAILGTVGIAHDVTDLANMGAELELILHSMPFAVMIVDMGEIIVNVNEKFRTLFEISSEEILGMSRETLRQHAIREYGLKSVDGRTELIVHPGGREILLQVYEREILDAFSNSIGKIVIFRDATLERQFEQRLEHNANTDDLTGLRNRRYFYEHLRESREPGPVALLYMDLDNFKQINDKHGHQAGDRVLITTARLLQDLFPEAEVARLGGDEFALYLIGCRDLERLRDRALGLLEKMEKVFAADAALEPLSASVGVVVSDEAGLDLDELVRRGDLAMYEAKRLGKRRCCVYTPELEKRLHESAEAERAGPQTWRGRH